ncbi:MAG TPA: hypothetical protein VHV83_02285 [Armatimonadota bacterium]|nr:hypothetical protein [Armatimonadota bacterium]
MKDQYVGDIGDFGKYGLLKAVCGYDPACPDGYWPLGVVWYRTPDGGPVGDGKFTGYLDRDDRNYRQCDPALYDALQGIVRSKQRNVRIIRERNVLSPGTTYFEEMLSFDGMPHIGAMAKKRRLAHREQWLQMALAAMTGHRVIFLDPDNGFASTSHRHHHTHGPKYVFFDELRQFVERDRTIVAYHHIDRTEDAAAQITHRTAAIQEAVGQCAVRSILYRRGTSRAYFIITNSTDVHVIDLRLNAFLDRGWRQHFELKQ